MKNQEIQDEFLLINVTRVEQGDQSKLLYMLDVTLIQIKCL